MYEAFFGFSRPPFLATPSLEGYFPGEQYEQCLETLGRVIQRGEGPAAIIASPGLGKSLLGLRLADDFRDSHSVVLLSSSQLCTRRALLQCLLFELDMPFRGLSEGELRLSLIDRLQGIGHTRGEDQGLLLIVDEAQTLPLKLLEELRMMTNLVVSGRSRVALVLLGSLRLEEHLGNPQLESLNQRIAARVYLHPLSGSETKRYVAHKIELAGARWESVIADGAIDTLYRATDGIPRLIDQTLDHALLLAARESQRPVTVDLIERAWSDLQQLPIAWHPESLATSNTAGIEFGPLDEGGIEDEFRDVPQVPVPPAATEAWPTATESHQRPAESPKRPEVEPALFPWMGDVLAERAERQLEMELDGSGSPDVDQPLPNALREIADPFGSDFDEEFVLDGSPQRWFVEGDSTPGLAGELIGSLDEGLQSEQLFTDARGAASDQTLPLPAPGGEGFPNFASKSAGGWPGDDRDLLVIEEEVVDPTPIEPQEELPVDFADEANQAYLQLFSRLRQ
jgi:type II secretory pathway predicted ATPase ExeA